MNFNFLEDGVIVYTILFFLLVFTVLLFEGRTNKQNKIIFIFFIILYILLGALRGPHVGSDTFGYINQIELLRSSSYSDIFTTFIKDPVAWAFFKLISSPFKTYTPYFFILQVIFWLSIGYALYKYSHNCLFALLIFVLFRFSYFNMSGMRQGLALAITFYSFRFIIEKKSFKFIALVFLASLFHKSAILFLVVYFIKNTILHNNMKAILILIFTGLFILIAPEVLESLVADDFIYHNYLNSESGSNIYLFILNVLSFTILYFNMRKNKKDNVLNTLFNLSLISMCFSLFSLDNDIAFRVAMYFGFFIPIALTNINITKKGKQTYPIIIPVIAICIIYVITGIPKGLIPYNFFWEV